MLQALNYIGLGKKETNKPVLVLTVTAIISSLKCPASWAILHFCCELAAKLSCSPRNMCHLWATFSARN